MWGANENALDDILTEPAGPLNLSTGLLMCSIQRGWCPTWARWGIENVRPPVFWSVPLDATASQLGFGFVRDGVQQIGYYDEDAQIFLPTVAGVVKTVMTEIKPSYIAR